MTALLTTRKVGLSMVVSDELLVDVGDVRCVLCGRRLLTLERLVGHVRVDHPAEIGPIFRPRRWAMTPVVPVSLSDQ